MATYKAPKFIMFKNISQHRLTVEDLGVTDLAPGETCPIQEGYAMPRRANSGARRPSVVEDLAACPGCEEFTKGKMPDGSPNHRYHCMMEPLNEEDRERFNRAPDEAPSPHVKTRMPTVADLVASGVPRGVAEQLVRAAIAAAQMAKDGEFDVETKADAAKAKPKKDKEDAKGEGPKTS